VSGVVGLLDAIVTAVLALLSNITGTVVPVVTGIVPANLAGTVPDLSSVLSSLPIVGGGGAPSLPVVGGVTGVPAVGGVTGVPGVSGVLSSISGIAGVSGLVALLQSVVSALLGLRSILTGLPIPAVAGIVPANLTGIVPATLTTVLNSLPINLPLVGSLPNLPIVGNVLQSL